MKSPEDLARRFARQWEDADLRVARLLGGEDVLSLSLPIGKPSPWVMVSNLDTVKRHVEAWRAVRIGSVIWASVAYRATAEAIKVPVRWELATPAEWAEASGIASVRDEWKTLARFFSQIDPLFHPLLVRRRSLWRERSEIEVAQAARLVMELSPGCARGLPLRFIALAGIDTKFFERHAPLITALLDQRYDGEAGMFGLETFLGAISERDHWLLVADLDGNLLPFPKLRITSADLKCRPLPAGRILVVENENCLHQLPPVPDTIAVLGAGFDLTWMDADWLGKKQVAYWGDIDTWGFRFLATARSLVPALQALMMTREAFEAHRSSAVVEAITAGLESPASLTPDETALYQQLLLEPRGRLEQEFLPPIQVQKAITDWLNY
jgi:hypothetical protein